MNIAVIGAGAIGSIVAAYLSQAGEDVVLIGRSHQVEAISKNGLMIKGIRGEENFKLNVLSRLDKNYDLVIFTVKTQDLEHAYNDHHHFVDESLILTTQNGVQADNILSRHFEREKIISSIVMFGATYVNPGEVVHNFEGDWIMGKPFGPHDPAVVEVESILKKAFNVVITPHIIGMKWLKLFVNFNNCLPALIGKSMQETFSDRDLCRLSVELLKEGLVVVQKAGIELVSLPQFPVERILGLAAMPIDQAAGIMSKTLTALSKEPLYGSILQSIMRRRTSEIDYINGEVVSLAYSIGMKAPRNARAVAMVHEVEEKGKYFSVDELKQAFEQKGTGRGLFV